MNAAAMQAAMPPADPLTADWLRASRRAVVAGIVAIGALSVMAGLFSTSVVDASARTPLTAEQMKGLVERGRYLVRAADCAACHTADGGAPLAGGRPFPMKDGSHPGEFSSYSPNSQRRAAGSRCRRSSSTTTRLLDQKMSSLPPAPGMTHPR